MGIDEPPHQEPGDAFRFAPDAGNGALPPFGFPPGNASSALASADRLFLLGLARDTIRHALGLAAMPELDEMLMPESLKHRRACFVTLLHHGELRGCIGQIFPQSPLYRSVIDSARGAALRDPRFPTLQAWELPGLHIKISALTEPKPLEFNSPEELLSQIRQGRDGIVVRAEGRTSTFLPQVWQQMRTKEHFLDRLCQKAGLDPYAWREKNIEVLTYEAESFEET